MQENAATPARSEGPRGSQTDPAPGGVAVPDGRDDVRIVRLLDLLHAGDHRSLLREAERLARTATEPTLRIRAEEVLARVRPDKVAVLTGIATLAFFLVVALLATVPHEQVVVAETLGKAIEKGDQHAARLLFTDEGWADDGSRLVEGMAGRRSRVFAHTPLGLERNFVRIEFLADPSGGAGRPRWTGRYLLFRRTHGGWRIQGVRKVRPVAQADSPERQGGGPR